MSTDQSLDSHSTSFIEPVTGDQLEQVNQTPAPTQAAKGSSRKKLLIITAVVIGALLLLTAGIIWFVKFGNGSAATAPTPAPAKKRVVEPTNIIEVSQRPVVYLVPAADGRNLTLQIDSIKKSATSAEYELEYQAGELLQGVNGAIDLASLPAKTTQLMGSCSAGGKCSYHENVKGGSLLLRFLGEENYALKQDWKYIDNKAKETAFSSKDAKFQLESPDLKTVRYLIIYSSPGYPENPPGTVVSDIYTLQTSSPLTGKGKLTLRAAEEGNLTIAGFDGAQWVEFAGTVDGKMVTAEVELLPLYVVVSK